jgi:hypothetical protein
MKKQQTIAGIQTEITEKKAALDNFSLFYEELPLQLNVTQSMHIDKTSRRLLRRSKRH